MSDFLGPKAVTAAGLDAAAASLVTDAGSDFRAAQDASYAGSSPLKSVVANSRSRLASRAAYDASRSNGYSQAAAAVATRFTEAWVDLTQWAVTSASVQVSAGKLFGVTGGGGANHSFRVPPGQTARAVFRVNYVGTGTAGNGVFVGFNRGAAGAAPAAGGAQSRGLYFRVGAGASDGAVNTMSDGAQTATSATGLGTSTWIATVTVDENWFSVSATAATGGAPRVVARWARDDAAYPLNNLSIMINDARGLTGCSVEAITEATLGGANSAFSTGNTLTASQASPCVHWGSDNGDNFIVMTPPGYDSRKPTPAAILFHGNGSDELHWLSNSNGKAVADQFIANGYVVIAAANTGSVSTWGAQAGIDAYTRAYQYARDHYNLGPVVFYANSMGSIESLVTLAAETIPGVSAWMGSVPTFDLAENYANALFTATIKSAYGIASDGSDYAAKTSGRDPKLLDPLLFRGIPMWMIIATDDVAVTPAANGQALYAAVASTNPATKVEVTGGHSTASIASNASAMVSWCNNILGLRNSYPA
jgi:hypothetical protein